ncbi:MAG: cobalamin-binding protein [Spirochaetales bacterium]|nr:cobalamin-binding protein [Spirochaetales bacterium]
MKKTAIGLILLMSAALWAGGNREESTETDEPALSYPQRIISLSPSTTETLFAIGAGDQVVGVTSYCNYPSEAATREIIGGFSPKTISIETIISLNPDLVIAGVSAHQPIADTLKEAGIAVLSIEPKSVDDVRSVIEELGMITGHEEQGKALSEEIEARIEAVQQKLAKLDGDRLRVFYEVWDAPLMTAGPESFTGQMITLAGGINIFTDAEGDYPQVSSEELVSRNPQAIIASETHGDKLNSEALREREGWDAIDAYINDRIILLDGDIVSRPGPRMIEAIEMMAEALYPELF